MIKVLINKENNKIKEIKIVGHAKYADYGKDIVCAAASSIVITSVNACLKLYPNSLECIQESNLIITVNSDYNEVYLLLDNMISLLNELACQYPKNITIKEE